MNSPKLSIANTIVENGCLVRLAGTIDESADAQSMVPTGADIVVFDLDGVRRITSYGVLQWVKALKDLRARYYAFMRCRPSMVRQFNMVAGFGKHGEVLSIYLPYFCEECDQEFETLLDLKQDYGLVQACTPPEQHCPRCTQLAEFDDVPKSYLAFSSDYPRPNPPELAQRLAQTALRMPPLVTAPSRQPPPPARPSRAPNATPSDAPSFPVTDSRLHGSLAPPREAPSTRDIPAVTTVAPAEAEPVRPPTEDASVNRLRKLQDELDVTRDRLSKMIKDRKSKS